MPTKRSGTLHFSRNVKDLFDWFTSSEYKDYVDKKFDVESDKDGYSLYKAFNMHILRFKKRCRMPPFSSLNCNFGSTAKHETEMRILCSTICLAAFRNLSERMVDLGDHYSLIKDSNNRLMRSLFEFKDQFDNWKYSKVRYTTSENNVKKHSTLFAMCVWAGYCRKANILDMESFETKYQKEMWIVLSTAKLDLKTIPKTYVIEGSGSSEATESDMDSPVISKSDEFIHSIPRDPALAGSDYKDHLPHRVYIGLSRDIGFQPDMAYHGATESGYKEHTLKFRDQNHGLPSMEGGAQPQGSSSVDDNEDDCDSISGGSDGIENDLVSMCLDGGGTIVDVDGLGIHVNEEEGIPAAEELLVPPTTTETASRAFSEGDNCGGIHLQIGTNFKPGADVGNEEVSQNMIDSPKISGIDESGGLSDGVLPAGTMISMPSFEETLDVQFEPSSVKCEHHLRMCYKMGYPDMILMALDVARLNEDVKGTQKNVKSVMAQLGIQSGQSYPKTLRDLVNESNSNMKGLMGAIRSINESLNALDGRMSGLEGRMDTMCENFTSGSKTLDDRLAGHQNAIEQLGNTTSKTTTMFIGLDVAIARGMSEIRTNSERYKGMLSHVIRLLERQPDPAPSRILIDMMKAVIERLEGVEVRTKEIVEMGDNEKILAGMRHETIRHNLTLIHIDNMLKSFSYGEDEALFRDAGFINYCKRKYKVAPWFFRLASITLSIILGLLSKDMGSMSILMTCQKLMMEKVISGYKERLTKSATDKLNQQLMTITKEINFLSEQITEGAQPIDLLRRAELIANGTIKVSHNDSFEGLTHVFKDEGQARFIGDQLKNLKRLSDSQDGGYDSFFGDMAGAYLN